MTVRWDAVAEPGRFWSEPRARAPGSAGAERSVAVQVWLFGRLAQQACVERPLALTMPNPFCVRDVIAELGRRCGGDFAAALAGLAGADLRSCRAFIDGMPAEDPDAPLEVRTSPATLEMILLTGIEGG